MILCSSGGGSFLKDDLSRIAELGFNYIACRGAGPNREFERTIKNAHEVGIKVVAIFPDWFELGLIGPEFSFQTVDGKTNDHFEGSEGRIEGPSYWHPEPDVRWRPALVKLAETGLDGILASPMHSDRMAPTDWYPFGGHPKYTTAFWSFDAHAKKAWAEHSDEEMPTQALVGHDGLPITSMTFYRWYQSSGWLNRITQLADAALDQGLKEIFTWWIPLDFFDEENMSDMTASSVMPLEGWRQGIIARGGHPVTVSACLAGLWARWRLPGIETVKQASLNMQWDAIAGPEAWGPGCLDACLNNGKLYADNGFRGLFAFTSEILNRFEEAKPVFAQVREMFGG